MDRPDLELVNAIRLHGSLAGAARSLGLSPPAATRRLAALESQLGVRLFQRSTRHVAPTAEGETLCARARELLQGFADTEAEIRERRSTPAGPIRLVGTFGFGRQWLAPALASFQVQYPAVQIQLHLTEQLPELASEGYDGAVWLWHAPRTRMAQWTSRRLARNQRVLVASAGYVASHGAPTHPDDLQHHACLVVRENLEPGQRQDHWHLHHAGSGQPASVSVRGPLSSNAGEVVRDWCLAGHGIMLRSLWDVAPLLESGALVRILPGWSMPDADIHWLAPYRPQVPRRIRLLVDFLAGLFRGEPWRPVSAPAAPPGSPRRR